MADVKISYETVFILSAKLGEEGITSTVQKFKDLIAENGTIDNVDEWGKRRLAYPIHKEEEGYYTLIAFTSSPDFTAELDRIYNITDGVLRSLTVKKEAPEKKPETDKTEEKKEA
ncbi:30S ribosomal protein S6 [Caproicibacter fermentans]|uniref:Small ribosomal subunit protein bS6 n=1 Tax=Caproicibacter fermentans TaxID=2576756 RepID=A0A7G8TAQ5_9FIRM|nr:30S ribosomal protein S6 [Caproicibacter fermentans]QNK40696.1 30S ribosomal protein S6 [Caproicibacter fermentans]